MGVISNLARETEALPAITREQLAVLQTFTPPLTIRDITKPREALWEFKCEQTRPMFSPVYVWMSEEGRVIATAYEDRKIVRKPGQQIDSIQYNGHGIKRLEWAKWLGGGDKTEEIADEYGIHSLGHDLYHQMQEWAIEQVENRVYEHGADYYGRVWEGSLPNPQCPICGQPKLQPCDHTKLPNDVVSVIRKSIATKE